MIEGLVLLDMASVIALLFVVLIGLPHGAFDGAIANHLGAGRSLAEAAKFITGYCAAAGLVIAIWIMFPAVTLTLFLIISMIHFGRGDASAQSRPVFMMQVSASRRFTNFWHYLFPAIKRHPAI
jgi:Brp/Blh family beta-carotene 15,15'-monooxygenase